ncbi:MAG: extracellular solute-binding protein [Clostridia bacterium]|nr:extracellular solute-binding protein [Clostridia bacterium]
MKRFVSMLLVAALLLSCLSFAVADGKKSLTIWIPQYQFSKDENAISDKDFWEGQLAEFSAENDVDVNVEILPWGDYNTTIYTGLLNNDGPDVVYVTDNYDLVQNDLLLGLDSYLTEEEKDNYLLWNLSPVNAAGEHVIVPMDDGVAVGYYNKDILAEAGIDAMPEEWDAFIEACKEIKDKTGKQGFLQNWGATTGTSALMLAFWPYYFQAGGEMLDENGEIAINNEAGLATLNFLKKLYDEGIFDETIVAETESIDKFANGELAFVVGDLNKGSSFTGNGVNWEYFFSLKGPKGYGARTATDSFAVASKSKERGTDELAVKALTIITSGKVMDAFHEQIFFLPRFTKDSTYTNNPKYDELTGAHTDDIYVVSEFEGKASFEKALQSNIQMMFMGDLTPEEVLSETMEYYQDQIKQ